MIKYRWMVNNLLLKLTALALAIACWFFIVWGLGTGQRYQQKVLEAVEIKILSSSDRSLTGAGTGGGEFKLEPQKMDLIVGGPRSLVIKLLPEDVMAFVDVSGLKTQSGYPLLRVELPVRVIFPEGIRLISPEKPMCEVLTGVEKPR